MAFFRDLYGFFTGARAGYTTPHNGVRGMILRDLIERKRDGGKLTSDELRDATATVECIPLIAASIMSKKLAEGLTGLVLDVKRGSGAFLPELERGLQLAQTMITLGQAAGVPVVTLLTAMDRPLGDACGNALEVVESLDALRGNGPRDLWTVTEALAIEMLRLARPGLAVIDARSTLRAAISSGAALDKFRQIVAAQGGDVRAIDDPARLPQASSIGAVESDRSGVVVALPPRAIGHAVIALGGGRTTTDDVVDPAVGVVMRVRVGDEVRAGQTLATVHASSASALHAGQERMRRIIQLGDGPPEAGVLPWVTHRVTAAGIEEWRA